MKTRKFTQTGKALFLRAAMLMMLLFIASFSAKAVDTFLTLTDGQSHSSTINIGAGDTYTITVTGNASIKGTIKGTGKLIKKGSGSLSIEENNTGFTGITEVQEGNLYIGTFNAAIRSGNLGGTINLTKATTNLYLFRHPLLVFWDYTFEATITGAGNVRIFTGSTNKVYFEKAHTYTGITVIYDNSILYLNKAGSISQSSQVYLLDINSKLDISGISATSTSIKNLIGRYSSGEVILGSKTLNIHSTENTYMAGKFTGSGIVAKRRAATLTLSGANTHTGGLDIYEGTIVFDKLDNLGKGPLWMNTNGTLKWANNCTVDPSSLFTDGLSGGTFDIGSNDVTMSSPIKNYSQYHDDLRKKGSGYLYLTANNPYVGKFIVEEGDLFLGKGGSTGNIAADIELRNNSALRFFNSSGSSTTYNGVISGTGKIVFTNYPNVAVPPKYYLTKAQTYTGPTEIYEPELYLTGNGNIASSSNLELNSAKSKFDISGVTKDVSVKTLESTQTGATVNLGSKNLWVGVNNSAGTFSYSGKILGNGNIAKTYPGKFIFKGTHSGTGHLYLVQGTLELASDWQGDMDVATGDLVVTGNRTIKGKLTFYSGVKTHFDLTANPRSKLTANGGVYYSGGASTLSVKCNTAGGYDLIEGSGVSANNFNLEMTGSWKNGELKVSGNKLQLVEATDNIAPTVSNKTITVGTTTTTSIPISWAAASDNVTAKNKLKYHIYCAKTSSEINAQVSNRAYTVEGHTSSTDPITYTLTRYRSGTTLYDLLPATTYYFFVEVVDEAGNASFYTMNNAKTKEAPDNTAPTVSNKTLTIVAFTHNSIKVSWAKATDNKTTQANLEYEVTYKEGSNSQSMGWKKNINTATITGLKAETSYTINVTVRDEAGNKTNYTAKTQKTKEAADNTAPTVSNKTLTIVAFTHNSIKVSWAKATDNKTTQANLEYEVTYKEGSNSQSMGWKKNINEAVLSGLKSDTEYTLNVTVRDEAGNKTSYTAKTQKTKEDPSSVVKPDANGIVYVKQGGTGNGSSWSLATNNLQGAIDAANVKEVWVAKGEYQRPNKGEYFSMKEGVKIYGGFPNSGTPSMTNRDWESNKTILRGNDNSVIRNDKNGLTKENALLDGFTVTGGREFTLDWNGGGIYNNEVSPTLSNLIITDNIAGETGGGIYNLRSNPIIKDVIISNNKAENDGGGGVANFESSPILTSVIIRENISIGYIGGGMNNYCSSPTLIDVTIMKNSSPAGGGMANESSSLILMNVIIRDNSGGDGGGMANWSSTSTLTNVSIINNVSDEGYGGGIINSLSSKVILNNVLISENSSKYGGGIYNEKSEFEIHNSIISGNFASKGGGIYTINGELSTKNTLISGNVSKDYGGGIYTESSQTTLINTTIAANETYGDGSGINNIGNETVLYNCIVLGNDNANNGDPISSLSSNNLIQTGGENLGAKFDGATVNNTTASDIFIDPQASGLSTAGDYRLKEGCFAVDRGDNSLFDGLDAETKDLDGNPRLINGIIDLGAYEAAVYTDTELPTINNKVITVGEVSDKSIELSWTKATDNKTAEANLEYQVTYSWDGGTSMTNWTKDIATATLSSLLADTEYTINVKVRDEAGNENSYEAVKVRTQESPDTEAPTIPNKTITVGEVTDKSIELSWTKATDNKTADANLEYQVTYSWDGGTSMTNWTKDIATATLSSLLADTEYTINVTVRDEAGNENSYEELKVTTLPYTGIETLEAMGIHIWSSKSVLHITLPQAELIELFDLSGALVYAESDAVGDIRIALKSGVYIVRIKGVTVKTIVR